MNTYLEVWCFCCVHQVVCWKYLHTYLHTYLAGSGVHFLSDEKNIRGRVFMFLITFIMINL